MPLMRPLSVYLHIPFCAHRCSYCDFNTYTSLSDLQEPYATALAQEVVQVAGQMRRPVKTLFLGGGTPSLMSPASLQHILDAVYERFDVWDAAEITLEANPNTVDIAYLRELRQLGINRLSFGAQSAVQSELQLLDRIHSFDRVVEAVAQARAAGFDNFNVDLIYGVPGQTLASWQHSMAAVLDLAPTHVSLYCLTIEPGTPMQRWLLNGSMAAPDPDLAADQFQLACDTLGAAGFGHYEISNWAQAGRECKHNLTYWRNGDYLGLGAGAHGHADGYRYHVVKQPRTYLRRMQGAGDGYPFSAALANKTKLSEADQISDTMMTQLRLLDEGVDMQQFERDFGRTLHDVYGATLTQLIEWGLLTENENRLLLTEQATFVSNQVFHRLML